MIGLQEQGGDIDMNAECGRRGRLGPRHLHLRLAAMPDQEQKLTSRRVSLVWADYNEVTMSSTTLPNGLNGKRRDALGQFAKGHPGGPDNPHSRKTGLLLATLLSLAMSVSTHGQEDKAQPLLKIGSRHELFLDDVMISKTHNVWRTLHQPQRHKDNPIYPAKYPEYTALIKGSVIRDPATGKFTMWYFAGTDVHNGYTQALAYSDDGLQWTRPELDVVRFNDGRGTNITMLWCDPKDIAKKTDIQRMLLRQTGNTQQIAAESSKSLVVKYPDNQTMAGYGGSMNVLYDPDDPDPQRRYKSYFRLAKVSHLSSFTCVSSDGVHWSNSTEIPQIHDTSCLMYDELKKKYVIYGRHSAADGRDEIQRTESDDFVTWTKPEVIFRLDDRDPLKSHAYDMMVYNVGNSYVGLLRMFYAKGIDGKGDYRTTETQTFQLATSRDGIHFTRVADRRTWIDLGPIGQFDRFRLDMAGQPIRMGNRLWFYYAGRSYRHGQHSDYGPKAGVSLGSIGLLTLRPDGYVSMDGSFDGAYLLTKPVLLDGANLHINAYARFGKIVVELLDQEGNPIDGYRSLPITVDGLDLPVKWTGKDNLGEWAGKPVQIRFNLINARLYSYWCQ